MIQVIGIPMESDPAPFFANLFLGQKEDDWVKKHYKHICSTELELKKENNLNSCASFLDLYISIENGEFHTN